TSGALFAQVGLDLYRSDDGGTSWRTVELPPAPGPNATRRPIVVDPISHQRMLAIGGGGLYRTADHAPSRQFTWPTDPDFPNLAAFTASPAGPVLLSLVVGRQGWHVIRMLRSQDGGQTWTTLEQDGHDFLACDWSVYLLQAHPTDADRLFRS